MIIYSSVLDKNSNFFLIQHLRKNKWLWDYRIFFDSLTIRQTAVLLKSILTKDKKVIFFCSEGSGHSFRYWRPYQRAKFIFGHMDTPNAIFYNIFFEEELKIKSSLYDHTSKSGSDLIEKVCFISSNYNKLKQLQNEDPLIYSELDIFGEYHTPIPRSQSSDRSADSLLTCSKYMASLCIENNEQEGYFQGSALWALYALTPPILKAAPKWKNFIRKEFVIDYTDYKVMNKEQRFKAISAVQERLYSGDTFLTNLSQDYIAFLKETFTKDEEPNLEKIIKDSKIFRKKFLKV